MYYNLIYYISLKEEEYKGNRVRQEGESLEGRRTRTRKETKRIGTTKNQPSVEENQNEEERRKRRKRGFRKPKLYMKEKISVDVDF